MIVKTAEPKFGRWTAPQVALSIEYRLDVMQQIRAAGADACGILFGTHRDDNVRILAWRRENAEGRDVVRSLLTAKQDPDLQLLQPVGWFVSHASGDISLTDSDIEIFDGFFGESWQVTLVLVPDRAGFVVREAGGSLCHRELTIAASKPQYLRWLWAIPTVLAAILAAMLIKPEHPLNPCFQSPRPAGTDHLGPGENSHEGGHRY